MGQKLCVVAIYEADNGDVFFEHNNNYEERSEDEIKALMAEAKRLYKTGEIKATPVRSEGLGQSGSIAISYYDGDKFLGHANLHITKKFHQVQQCIYLKQVNKKSNDLVSKVAKVLPS